MDSKLQFDRYKLSKDPLPGEPYINNGHRLIIGTNGGDKEVAYLEDLENLETGITQEQLDNAINNESLARVQAIDNLENQILSISLTPGPKGDKGDKGDTGPTGPPGPMSQASGSPTGQILRANLSSYVSLPANAWVRIAWQNVTGPGWHGSNGVLTLPNGFEYRLEFSAIVRGLDGLGGAALTYIGIAAGTGIGNNFLDGTASQESAHLNLVATLPAGIYSCQINSTISNIVGPSFFYAAARPRLRIEQLYV